LEAYKVALSMRPTYLRNFRFMNEARMWKIFLTGVLVLAALFVLMRIVRKGRGRNYGESKKAFEERVRKTGAQARDYTLSAGVAEQMRPIAAAIRELLEFTGNSQSFALLEEGRIVRLQSPAGEIRIDFGFAGKRAALNHKAGHPQKCWRINGPGAERKEYVELADAVAHLQRMISGA
jgi:hypothetical protein